MSGILTVTPTEPPAPDTPPVEPPAVTPPEVPPTEPVVEAVREVQCSYCNDTHEIIHGGVIPCPYCTEEGIAKYGLLAIDPASLDAEAQKGYVESRRTLGI